MEISANTYYEDNYAPRPRNGLKRKTQAVHKLRILKKKSSEASISSLSSVSVSPKRRKDSLIRNYDSHLYWMDDLYLNFVCARLPHFE